MHAHSCPHCYAENPSRALMEISQLLTQTADDFHKIWPRKLSYLIVGAPAMITTTESDDTGGLVSVGTYLWDKQYLIDVFSVPLLLFFHLCYAQIFAGT